MYYQQAPMVVHDYPAHGVAPDNTVYGDCGSSYVYMPGQGSLMARVDFGATSVRGAITYVSWTLDFYNSSGQHVDSKTGSQPWSSPDWDWYIYEDFSPWGDGDYSVVLNGWVQTSEGYQCTFLQPYDIEHISGPAG